MEEEALLLNLYQRAHQALLLFQRRMRKVRLGYNYPIRLTAPEAIILSLLAKEPELTPKRIVEVVRLPKSKVSRVLSYLERNDYLVSVKSRIDARSKHLSFTDRGRALLSELDQINTAIALDGSIAWSERERAEAAHFLSILATGLGSPLSEKRPNEDLLVPQQRRVIQISGMVAKEYMESGIDIAGYQLLFELSRQNKSIRFTELVNILPFEVTRLSRHLSTFSRKGLVKRTGAAEDKRAVFYELSEKGKDYFSRLEEVITKKYERALSSLSRSKIESFISLVSKMIAVEIPDPGRTDASLTRCERDRDYFEARRIMVEILVKHNLHQNLPDTLLPKTHLSYLIKAPHNSIGVIEFSHFKVEARLLNLVILGDYNLEDNQETILRLALAEVFRSGDITAVHVAPELLSSRSLASLGAHFRNGEYVVLYEQYAHFETKAPLVSLWRTRI